MSDDLSLATVPPAGVLRIGDWTVEPDLNRLSSGQAVVRLEPKAMALLVRLAERPGQVVSRTELLSTIWPDVIVGDDSLTQVVIKLRKALGDAADHPAYIETIAKRGYRLIATVQRVEEASPQALAGAAASPDRAATQEDEAAPAGISRAPRAAWMIAAGVAAVLFAAGLGVWWVASESQADVALAGSPMQAGSRPRVEAPTVAIRPFEALGGSQDEELLAQGVTADLLTDLSKVFGLWIIGTDSAGEKPASDGASSASAIDYRVAGSVQSTDRRLRLNVRLTDARTGELIWSERFERELSDLFAIQDELVARILAALGAKVSEAELRRMARRHTRNLAAYELFQRGQRALLTRQRGENEVARELFRRAIGLDASFARAYAALALTYAADFRNQWSSDGAAALNRAFEIANTANQINPDVAETYWVLAFVHMERRQHDKALQFLGKAVQVNPSYADAYALIGGIRTYLGRPSDSVESLRTAIRLDPQAGHLHFLNLGRAYVFLGDAEQARLNLDQALARNPANLETHVYLAALHVMSGNKVAAAWEVEEIRSLQPDFSIKNWLRTYPMTDEAQRAKLSGWLGELGL